MGDKTYIDGQIARIAARQQGNITRRQLLSIGLARESIRWRVKTGRLFRVHRGVYSVGTPPVTPLEHAMAAVLACGPGAVLTHGSALTLWGIWKRWDRPFDVIVSGDRRPKGIRIHRCMLARQDMTRQQGIPVTTLARALLDMAPKMPPKSLNRAVNNARQDSHLQLSALRDVIRRYPNHRGRRRLEHVLGDAGKRPTRSHFEDDFPAFCERYGLPQPEMDAIVCGYEVDALFEVEKVIVELDGWHFHSSKFSFEGDRDRDADTTAGGFVTVRITRERYESRPEREASRLHVILERRREHAA